jgi:hypothetical protein
MHFIYTWEFVRGLNERITRTVCASVDKDVALLEEEVAAGVWRTMGPGWVPGLIGCEIA